MPNETSSPSIEINRSRVMTWPARAVLVLLTAWMCLNGYLKHPLRYDLEVSTWVNADAPRIEQVVRRLFFEWGTDLAGFFALGALAYLALGPSAELRTDAKRRIGLILGLALALGGLVRGIQLGRLPLPGHLLLPLLAFFFGAWVVRACVRGRRALLWLGVQIAAILLMLGGAALMMGWLAFQDQPFSFEPIKVSMGEKRQLANKVRGTREGDDWARRIRLTGADLNQMAAAGLSQVSPASKARVQVEEGRAEAKVSYALQIRGKPRYINLHVRGAARINNGELSLQSDRLSIGSVGIPRLVLALVAPQVASTIRHDRDLRNIVGSIASLRVKDDTVETVFKPGECNNTFLPAVALAISGKPNLVVPTREYVRHLVEGSGDLPAADGRFVELLRRAFAFAKERSVEGDPVLENRSALVALAILLGHERVESVVGPVLDEPLREMANHNLQGVTLRGRGDWTKHFYVSAAMALIACEQKSDKVGVLKEVLDAEEGGSGFSFSDLAANRAGIRLARVATYNADSARSIQAQLGQAFPVDAVFPDVADLPENLKRDEFQAKYGGVNGEGYRKLGEEIDRRLSQCSALK